MNSLLGQQLSVEIANMEKELLVAKEELDREFPKIGNIVHDSVPVSNDEEADSETVSTFEFRRPRRR